MNIPRLVITPGEPAGIGPDVTVKIAQESWPVELVAITDPEVMKARAEKLGLKLELSELDPAAKTSTHTPHTLKIIPVTAAVPVVPGKLNVRNAQYVLRTLELAARLCLQNTAQGVITGPVHKGNMQDAGIDFSGHTEYFAQQSGVSQTVMLFVVDKMKVALATTHLPLARVPAAITKEHLRKVLMILHDDLQKKFHLRKPRIAVCGLNPHAGEDGHLGREEIEIITPLIQELRERNYLVEGPYPADTAFLPRRLQDTDAVLAMYHDQALPLIKYIGFDSAVNLTLGLPFVRTSVDHGTALEIAGTNASNPGSMAAAIDLAIKLSQASRLSS